MLKRLSSLAPLLALMSCATGSSSALIDRNNYGNVQTLAPFEALDDDVTGIWESRGYGWIFEIDRSGITQYQVAADACFKTPVEAKGLTDTLSLDYAYYRAGFSPNMLILQLLPEDTEIHLKRIEALPEACGLDVNAAPASVIRYMADLIGEHYAFFDERSIDWPERVRTALADSEL
ncbi:MAG: hypothetical protein RLN72_11780, partial [Henriciella sp.]